MEQMPTLTLPSLTFEELSICEREKSALCTKLTWEIYFEMFLEKLYLLIVK